MWQIKKPWTLNPWRKGEIAAKSCSYAHNRRMSHPRTQQRVGGPDTEDNDRVRHPQTENDRNQKDTDETASWKRRERPWFALLEFALLVEVPRGIADERDSADRTVTPTGNKTKMNGFVEISTLLIHSAPKQKSNEWMHLSPFYTRMHGEWLRYAKSTSQFHWRFLLVRDVRGFQVRTAAAYLGVRRREKGDGRMRSDRDERGERGEKKISVRFPGHTAARSSTSWAVHSRCHAMVLDLFGGRPDAHPPPGGRRWLLRSRAAGSESPVPCSSPNMADGSRLRPPGERGDSSAPSRTAATLLDPGARQRVFRPTCSSFAPAPPLRAATGGLRHFLLPDLLSTAIPLSSEGSLTACPSFLPGFGTNVTQLIGTGRRRREPANI